MTPRAKCDPLISRALSTTKLDSVKNAYLFFVFLPETLQLLLCFLAVKAFTLKVRLECTILRLKNGFLALRVRKLVESKRQTLAEYVSHWNFP